VQTDRQTDKQTDATKAFTPATVIGIKSQIDWKAATYDRQTNRHTHRTTDATI